MSHIVRIGVHGEGDGRAAGYVHAVAHPAAEGVTRGRCSGKSAALALLVGARAAHRASVGRVGRGGDGVGVRGLLHKVSHQMAGFRHSEGVVGRGGNLASLIGPLLEGVATAWRGVHRAGLALLIGAAAAHSAAIGWAGGKGDGAIEGRFGSEFGLCAVGRPRAVDGVGAGIVVLVGCQADKGGGKSPSARAANDVRTGCGGIGVCAIADAALCNSRAAAVGYITTTHGGELSDVGDTCRGQHGKAGTLRWADTYLWAIAGARAIEGVGSNIISGIGVEPSEGEAVAARSGAVVVVEILHGRALVRAPAYTSVNQRTRWGCYTGRAATVGDCRQGDVQIAFSRDNHMLRTFAARGIAYRNCVFAVVEIAKHGRRLVVATYRILIWQQHVSASSHNGDGVSVHPRTHLQIGVVTILGRGIIPCLGLAAVGISHIEMIVITRLSLYYGRCRAVVHTVGGILDASVATAGLRFDGILAYLAHCQGQV